MSDDEALLVSQRLVEAARAFIEAVGLPADTVVEQPGLKSPSFPSDALVRIMKRGRRQNEITWWRSVAEDWLEVHQPGIARACVERARQLVLSGTSVSWESLNALGALCVAIDEWKVPAASQGRMTGQPAIARESAEQKQLRISTIFSNARQRRPDASTALTNDDLAAAMVRGQTEITPWMARAWYETNQHHLLVEHLLLTIAARPIAAWRNNMIEQLIWCGRALLRVGDQNNAWGCFWLAVGMDSTVITRSNSKELHHIVVARDHLRRLEGNGRPGHPDGVGRITQAVGNRLATWLLDCGIEGTYVRFRHQLRRCERRADPGAIGRQHHFVARTSGWFERATAVSSQAPGNLSRLVGPVPSRLPAGVDAPTPAGARGPRPGFDWSRPTRVRRAVWPRTSSPVAIGVTEAGRTAGLDVTPDAQVMILGDVATPELMESVAEQLVNQGWTVVHLVGSTPASADRARGAASHRLIAGEVPSSDSKPWLMEMAALPDVRKAVQGTVTSLLPAEADPSVTACVAELLHSADRRHGLFTTTDPGTMSAQVTTIVDSGARLGFQTPADLWRAATLLNHTIEAATLVGRALSLRWVRASRPEAPVVVEAAGPAPEIRIRLTVLLDSLAAALGPRSAEPSRFGDVRRDDEDTVGADTVGADAVGAEAGKPEDVDGADAGQKGAQASGPDDADGPPEGISALNDEPGTDRSEDEPSETDEVMLDLAIRRHHDPADVAELIAAVKAADHWSEPNVDPPAPGDASTTHDPSGSPWVVNGAVRRGVPNRACLMVEGGLGEGWNVVLDWFRRSSAEHDVALIIGTRDPGQPELALAGQCQQYVVGRLAKDIERRFTVAAGLVLPLDTARIDRHCGLLVTPTPNESRVDRFVLLPSRYRGN